MRKHNKMKALNTIMLEGENVISEIKGVEDYINEFSKSSLK